MESLHCERPKVRMHPLRDVHRSQRYLNEGIGLAKGHAPNEQQRHQHPTASNTKSAVPDSELQSAQDIPAKAAARNLLNGQWCWKSPGLISRLLCSLTLAARLLPAVQHKGPQWHQANKRDLPCPLIFRSLDQAAQTCTPPPACNRRV